MKNLAKSELNQIHRATASSADGIDDDYVPPEQGVKTHTDEAMAVDCVEWDADN